jgi:enhancer of polycomb-like protein
VPKGLPDSKALTRMARNVYPHWRQRREIRKGKSIFPGLNYDEANDGDPYVCFRRRDIRATRKTRRTDNYSVDKFQKLQYELQTAHQIVSMVQQRERHKKSSLRLDKELWEAKWKLFETKRKWPSLGVSREEEEVITGRSQQLQVQQNRENAAFNGAHALQPQSANVAQIRKKQPDREKDERERRERAIEMARAAEKGVATGGRSMAPESLKERAMALKQRLEEALARRNAANAEWDDFTDVRSLWVQWRGNTDYLVFISTATPTCGGESLSDTRVPRPQRLCPSRYRPYFQTGWFPTSSRSWWHVPSGSPSRSL